MKSKLAVVAALVVAAGAVAALWPSQTGAQGPAAAAQKIGILDVRQAIVSSAEGKQASAELQSRFAPRQAELETIRKQIDDIQKRLQAGERTLSDEEKGRLAREADRLSRLGQRKQEDLRDDLQEAENEVLQTIGGKLRGVVDRYARENGFSLILDVSGQSSNVAYFSNTIDTTQDIIRMYDAAHPLKGAAPPAKAPATPAQPPKQPAKPPQQ